ncbi:hypothetical protein HYH03_004734 [Edaphochlamys debaryana]|uniref:SET domain-containing protein n=1 Tax=Edaphochlamys debaryana TaxID=47281 RepID=A0A836C2W4_9CHLO|nr:hypothetical protein HYH03_004734 [Edaphochlamys debaryana]|eukprot:KAG2497143.1 hypothetical protein HYH03_004734 [Edaphochlamys debaryana]
MQRTLLHGPCGRAPPCHGPATSRLSVAERILSSFATSTSSRCPCSRGAAPHCGSRHARDLTSSAKGRSSGKSSGGQGFKGFGEPPKAPQKAQRGMTFDSDSEEVAAADQAPDADDDEGISLKPSYQMYTDAGYKAQRFVGPVSVQHPEGAAQPVLCATQDMLPGDLLLVTPALGFVEGGFQTVPELEDLHAAMLEDGPSPAQRRVLDMLEVLRPPAPTSTPDSSSSAAASSSPAQSFPSPLPSLTTMETKFWASRGRDSSAPEFNSKRLMQLLSRTAASSDSQDPAAMQARHQKPVGYVALWPEHNLLGHSCVPNTSQLVVADRLFVHLTDELRKGAPLTRNWIGPAVAAPLGVRQAAVAEALEDLGVPRSAIAAAAAAAKIDTVDPETNHPLITACGCARCRLEASVSMELRETLDWAHTWFVNEASTSWNKAQEEEDLTILKGLLTEAEAIVTEVEEAVQNEPGLDDEQQDWLRASVYDVYDLLVTLDELVNQDTANPDYLQTCLELIRVHSPGSDNHVLVAMKNESLRSHRLEVFSEMLKRERGGPKAIAKGDRRKLKALKDATDMAAEFRIEAFILRYGYVTEAILGQLTEGLETYVEGLEQMSVMQAQGMTELTREMEVDGVKVQIVDKLEVSSSSGGRGGAEILNEDGMQVVVMDGSGADASSSADVGRRPKALPRSGSAAAVAAAAAAASAKAAAVPVEVEVVDEEEDGFMEGWGDGEDEDGLDLELEGEEGEELDEEAVLQAIEAALAGGGLEALGLDAADLAADVADLEAEEEGAQEQPPPRPRAAGRRR